MNSDWNDINSPAVRLTEEQWEAVRQVGFIPSFESNEIYAASPRTSRLYGFQFTAPNGDAYLGDGRQPNLIVRVLPNGTISQVDKLPQEVALTRVSAYVSNGKVGIEISNMFLQGIEIEVYPVLDYVDKSGQNQPLVLTPGCIHVPPANSGENIHFFAKRRTPKGYADLMKKGLKISKLIQEDIDAFLDLPQRWVDTHLTNS